MKIPSLALSMLVFCASSAFATEIYVPVKAAKPLFQALASAFPQAKKGFSHSESVFVESFSCFSNEDEYLCMGKSIDGVKLVLEGGNPVPQENEANKKLDALWKAMKSAKLPIESGEGYSTIELNHLACDHTMPGSGSDSYECGYIK